MEPGAPLLDGLRIVEISSFVAAPLGGMTLAQLGADVIRIDPLGGAADTARWPLAPSGESLLWTGMNKGKRSITADFRTMEGREVVTRLAAEAGIVLTNAVGRDWLTYEALTEYRPDLIHLQVEGHHDGGAAVDYTVNAEIGFPLVTGPPELAGPVNHVLPAWDIACGLYAAGAVRVRAPGSGCRCTTWRSPRRATWASSPRPSSVRNARASATTCSPDGPGQSWRRRCRAPRCCGRRTTASPTSTWPRAH
jgi:crotonobetainyl-CoA:carnitine CoA-transferase CaiB-like acyl-CoA transferase